MKLRHLVIVLALGGGAIAAQAQPAGHLGVPGMQQVHSGFAQSPGLPGQNHYLLNVVHPDGTVGTMSSGYLAKQTLVYTDFVLLLWRNAHSTIGNPDSGEIYLADYDSTQKSRPMQDQMPLVRFTIAPNETRAVMRVTMTAGRAYSGYRQPLLVNYSGTVDMNARALGYLLPN
jgi:hypothetical protein